MTISTDSYADRGSASVSAKPRGRATSTLIGLCAAANLVNAADRILMPIAIVPIAKEYKIDIRSQGWILSAFPIGYVSSQLLGGKAAQRFGAKRVLAAAVFLWSLTTFLTPLLTPFPLLLIVSRVALGFGEGLGLPAIFHAFGRDVPVEERSRAFGYLVAMGSAGQVLAAVFAPRASHWSLSFHSLGLVGFAWLPIWLCAYEENRGGGGGGGAVGGGDGREEEKEGLLIVVDEVDVQRMARHDGRRWRKLWGRSKQLWDSSVKYFNRCPLWAIYIAHFSMNWSNYIVMNWLPTYLTDELGAEARTVSYIAVPFFLNFLLNIVSGHVADFLVTRRRWSLLAVRRLMTSVGLFGPAAALLAFCAASDLRFALFFVACSMGLCAFNSSGHLANHADLAPHSAGVTFAISNTLATVPGIVCGPFTAELVSQSGNRWFPVFVLASFINVVGALGYLTFSDARQMIK